MNENKKILVVEDEARLLEAIKAKLLSHGFNVDTAQDGKTALEKSSQNNYDLILLDLILPVMDGLSFLEKYRQIESGSKTPIIILTNLNSDETIAQSKLNNVNDYLVKTDWSLEDIVNKINSTLNKDE